MSDEKTTLSFNIAGRPVGDGAPCFIIAEAGVNHNGDIGLARKLIEVAAAAGADAVKFQTFRAEDMVTGSAEKAPYQKETTGSEESQIDMLKKLELSRDDFEELSGYACKEGLIFLSTPFDKGSVDLLDDIDVPAFKIASSDITNIPLLAHVAGKKKPVILSTGMSTLAEVQAALGQMRQQGAKEIVLLHCVSSYPARIEESNLRAMATLRQTFNMPVGLSDHTPGITVPVAATALGACIIEKHFTLDKEMPGPDHRASLSPGELKEMVKAVRDTEKALGDGEKRPTASEEKNKQAVRRSIVAAVDIPAGTVITEEMLGLKRPGTGLSPGLIKAVIGLKAVGDISKDEAITLDKAQ